MMGKQPQNVSTRNHACYESGGTYINTMEIINTTIPISCIAIPMRASLQQNKQKKWTNRRVATQFSLLSWTPPGVDKLGNVHLS